MEVFIIALLVGLIPAFIAQGKGRSFVLWWIYGALIFIVALPHSLIMKADQQSIEKQQLSEGMKKRRVKGSRVKRSRLDMPLPV
jgi:hypothetical protein